MKYNSDSNKEIVWYSKIKITIIIRKNVLLKQLVRENNKQHWRREDDSMEEAKPTETHISPMPHQLYVEIKIKIKWMLKGWI